MPRQAGSNRWYEQCATAGCRVKQWRICQRRVENEDNFVRTAAGFAIAMLPRLFADGTHLPQ